MECPGRGGMGSVALGSCFPHSNKCIHGKKAFHREGRASPQGTCVHDSGPGAPLHHPVSSLPSHQQKVRPLSTRQLPWVGWEVPSWAPRKLRTPKEALWFPTVPSRRGLTRGGVSGPGCRLLSDKNPETVPGEGWVSCFLPDHTTLFLPWALPPDLPQGPASPALDFGCSSDLAGWGLDQRVGPSGCGEPL